MVEIEANFVVTKLTSCSGDKISPRSLKISMSLTN